MRTTRSPSLSRLTVGDPSRAAPAPGAAIASSISTCFLRNGGPPGLEQEAAVHRERRPGDEICPCEEEDRVGHVFGAADPTECRLCRAPLELLGRDRYRPGRHAAHAD